MYRDQGVPEYWVIDLDARTIERSTPVDDRVEVAADSLEWRPRGSSAPLIIDLKRYFADVLDG
jgi:Uma2 family endonuclease